MATSSLVEVQHLTLSTGKDGQAVHAEPLSAYLQANAHAPRRQSTGRLKLGA